MGGTYLIGTDNPAEDWWVAPNWNRDSVGGTKSEIRWVAPNQRFGGWHQMEDFLSRISFFSTEGAVLCLAQGEVLRALRAILLPWDHLRGATRSLTQGSAGVRKTHVASPWAKQSAGPLARRTNPGRFTDFRAQTVASD